MKEITTYGDLLAKLETMTEAELNQPVQIADPPNDCRPVELQQGIAIGTVGEFEFEGSRSVIDNRYHADEVVILIDGNPHAEDGAVSYLLKNEGPKEKQVVRHIPQYGPHGKTERVEQYRDGERPEFPTYIGQQCSHRTGLFRSQEKTK